MLLSICILCFFLSTCDHSFLFAIQQVWQKLVMYTQKSCNEFIYKPYTCSTVFVVGDLIWYCEIIKFIYFYKQNYKKKLFKSLIHSYKFSIFLFVWDRLSVTYILNFEQWTSFVLFGGHYICKCAIQMWRDVWLL